VAAALELDRMAIDDVGFTPERIALEIHRQLGDIAPPIPVEGIALDLDIIEIQRRPAVGYEGSLLTDPERSGGVIQVNKNSFFKRQRYSIAHELGHFLCAWHQPTSCGRFACTKRDMIVTGGDGAHARQETEANSFAIDLLAPIRFFSRYQRRLPDLDHVRDLSNLLDLSKTATTRRYVMLRPEPLAAVFCRDGIFQYVHRNPSFPWLPFKEGDRLPPAPSTGHVEGVTEMVEIDSETWLDGRRGAGLSAQVLEQQAGTRSFCCISRWPDSRSPVRFAQTCSLRTESLIRGPRFPDLSERIPCSSEQGILL